MLSRRAMLLGVGGTLLTPIAGAQPWGPADRRLWLYSVNTGENGYVDYMVAGRYDADACRRLDWFFRDWRRNEMIAMDRRVFDALFVLQRMFPSPWPLAVASGYRTPATNAWLAERMPGVARNSYHVRGQAVDFWVPGRRLDEVYGFLDRWAFGGLALYRRGKSSAGGDNPHGNEPLDGRGWIHCDIGPNRRWVG